MIGPGQRLTLERPLGPDGAASVTRTIAGVQDKGGAAVLECVDVVGDGDGVLATATSQWWLAGAGGFQAARGPTKAAEPARASEPPTAPEPARAVPPALPGREPDARHSVQTTVEQAALYRLSGDLNPIHIDPGFAHEAGQPRPILHGLCTFGALGHVLAMHAPERRLVDLSARFVAPVFPGDRLDVAMWWTGPGEAVATVSADRRVVLGPASATLG